MSGPEQTVGPVVAVALKWVDCRPEVDPLTGAVATDPRTSGTSAADRSALEWALRAAEAWSGHVVAVTVGLPGADVVLREAMAAGARRAVRVEAPGDAPSADVAADLAAVVGGASLVVCGDWSLDRGSGSVPAFLADHLGAAQALGCTGLAVDPGAPGAVRADRRLDGGRRERLRVRPPGVVSVEGGSALLRRASLAGVLRSRRSPIEVVAPTSRGRLPAPPPPLGRTDPLPPAPEIRSESPPPAPTGGPLSPPRPPAEGRVSPSPAPEGRSDAASPAPEDGSVSRPAQEGRPEGASSTLGGGRVSPPTAPVGGSAAVSPAPEDGSVSPSTAPEGCSDPAGPAPAYPPGAGPAVPRRSAYRPRPRVLPPPPAGLDARQRILVLTGALVERTRPRLLVLDPPAAAECILDQLRRWGYLHEPSGLAARETDAANGPAGPVCDVSGSGPWETDAASRPAAGVVRGVSAAAGEAPEPGGAQREVESTSGPAEPEAAGPSGGAAREADGRSGAAAPEAG